MNTVDQLMFAVCLCLRIVVMRVRGHLKLCFAYYLARARKSPEPDLGNAVVILSGKKFVWACMRKSLSGHV